MGNVKNWWAQWLAQWLWCATILSKGHLASKTQHATSGWPLPQVYPIYDIVCVCVCVSTLSESKNKMHLVTHRRPRNLFLVILEPRRTLSSGHVLTALLSMLAHDQTQPSEGLWLCMEGRKRLNSQFLRLWHTGRIYLFLKSTSSVFLYASWYYLDRVYSMLCLIFH